MSYSRSPNGPISSTLFRNLSSAIAFATAISVAATIGATLDVDTDFDISAIAAAGLTVACNVRMAGGRITTGAKTLTFTGNFEAHPNVSCFDKAGTGLITFARMTISSLRWFSPTADGATDDTNPTSRWNNSAPWRLATGGRYAKNKLIPQLFTSNFRTHVLTGDGIDRTIWISLDNDHIWDFAGVGRNYNNWNVGNFTGRGNSTGTNYVLHFDAVIGDSFTNWFHDIFAENMGGGVVADNKGVGGILFSTKFERLQAIGCLGHNIDLFLSNTSAVIDCYIHTTSGVNAAYRGRAGGEWIRCNCIDSGGTILGIWGESTDIITINGCLDNTGTPIAVVLPADAKSNEFTGTLTNCNFEDFAAVGGCCKSGNIRRTDDLTHYLIRAAYTGIALYLHLGTQNKANMGIIDNYAGAFLLNPGSAWVHGVPIHAATLDTRFRYVQAAQGDGELLFYDVGGASTRILPTARPPASFSYNGTLTGSLTLMVLGAPTMYSWQPYTLTGNVTAALDTTLAYTGAIIEVAGPSNLGGKTFTVNGKSYAVNTSYKFVWDGSAWVTQAGGPI